MIKFFRHIRQKLLEENRFSKYLLYAIGEIVLVVIGILIALQINNWNEKNKSSKKEEQYLAQLLNDFEANQRVLGYYKTVYDEQVKYLDVILRHTGPKANAPSAAVFDSIQYLDSPTVAMLYATNASQGNLDLDLLTNNHLKQFIQALPVAFGRYSRNEKGLGDLVLKQRRIHQQYIPLKLMERNSGGQENFRADTLGLLRDMEFQNASVDRLWVTNSAINALTGVEKHNDSIISLIRGELNMLRND